jgi:hypothetical protein
MSYMAVSSIFLVLRFAEANDGINLPTQHAGIPTRLLSCCASPCTRPPALLLFMLLLLSYALFKEGEE